MNKDELAKRFDEERINILVQGYEHGEKGDLHKDLETSNNFGSPNKSLEEAIEYQKKCREGGLNRFIVVREEYRRTEDDLAPFERIREALSEIIYDYLKDYRGIPKDSIKTTIYEDDSHYAFRTLARHTEGEHHKIVVHAPTEMKGEETTMFYYYLSRTLLQYSNVRFLVLDQVNRGIEPLNNFEVMRWQGE
jgi:hypothetical protein